MIAELPPILSGSPQRQLSDLRDYLVRLAQSLETVSEAAVSEARTVAEQAMPAREMVRESVEETSGALRSLIIKTANEVNADIEAITQTLQADYVARSEFGDLEIRVTKEVTDTALDTLAEYRYDERISSLETSITKLGGYIRQGVVIDPDNQPVIGIAISQDKIFEGTWTDPVTGAVYDRIKEKQTFGLYTSEGWQFWLDGVKVGWFDSTDKMLHTVNLVTENSFTIGKWRWTALGGLGVKYTGVRQQQGV